MGKSSKKKPSKIRSRSTFVTGKVEHKLEEKRLFGVPVKRRRYKTEAYPCKTKKKDKSLKMKEVKQPLTPVQVEVLMPSKMEVESSTKTLDVIAEPMLEDSTPSVQIPVDPDVTLHENSSQMKLDTEPEIVKNNLKQSKKRTLPTNCNSRRKRKKTEKDASQILVKYLSENLSPPSKKYIPLIAKYPVSWLMHVTEDTLEKLGIKEIGLLKEIDRVLEQFFSDVDFSDLFELNPYENSRSPTDNIPEFDVGESTAYGGGCRVRFEHTPKAAAMFAKNAEEARKKLAGLVNKMEKTREQWSSEGNAHWIQNIIADLSDEQLDKIKAEVELEIKDKDFTTKWEIRSRFVQQAILRHWFVGKTLEEVIERARSFGHFEFPGGLYLKGPGFQSLRKKKVYNTEDVKKACSKFGSAVSTYTISEENCFQLEFSDLKACEDITYEKRTGSLNTTVEMSDDILKDPDYSADENLIRDYFQQTYLLNDGVLRKRLELNRRFYFIWKFPGYATGHHQDIHVSPHCTIYNQLSGVSYFHFLPLLIGLYVSHIGSSFGPETIAHVLRELDKRKIGEYAVSNPKSDNLVFITPFGSHGVFVPDTAINPQFDFEVSAVRACELYLRSTREHYRKILSEMEWWDITGLKKPVLPDFLEHVGGRVF